MLTPLKGKNDSDREPRKYTLLVVDDEEGVRQTLKFIFKDDYSMLLAETGSQAIELAQANRVDVVISDIQLGGMSGIELLGKLKAIDSEIEVIMLTAHATSETERQALRYQANDYLDKPFDVSVLTETVKKAIKRREKRREELESKLKAMEDEMHVKMHVMSVKLLEVQTQLQSKEFQAEVTKSRGEIYASIIHDINGPLTIISGFIQLINVRIADVNRVEGEDLEMVKDRLKRMTRQVTNCIEISQRYLSFMRQRSMEFCEVRVNQVLTDLEELLRAQPGSSGHELMVKTLPKDVTLQINGTDLIQILLNLAINGFQCSEAPHRVKVWGDIFPDGSPMASIAESSSTDVVLNREGFKPSGSVLLLTVQDTGPGIPPEIISKIFEPYFSTKSPGQGTGLGLSIVHRLLKEANGLLHLHSAAGEGTTFHLYFPARTIHE